jgi:hypothetical protein
MHSQGTDPGLLQTPSNWDSVPINRDPLQFQSNASALAGALTLPDINSIQPREHEQELAEQNGPDPASTLPPRYCSIKGCKRVISGDYLFKMCQPCRNRYRAYGTVKRTKWKENRQSALVNLEAQRAEDERHTLERGSPVRCIFFIVKQYS